MVAAAVLRLQADAMVMARLFSEFFRLGGIVIATSNRAPTNLYENGLQRSLFIPFIKTLERQVVVHDMDSYENQFVWVFTENLLENTDGVGAPHQCSLSGRQPATF